MPTSMNTQNTPTDLISAKEAAVILGSSRTGIYDLVKSQQLTPEPGIEPKKFERSLVEALAEKWKQDPSKRKASKRTEPPSQTQTELPLLNQPIEPAKTEVQPLAVPHLAAPTSTEEEEHAPSPASTPATVPSVAETDNSEPAPATPKHSKAAKVPQARETASPAVTCESIPEGRKVALSAINFDAQIQVRAGISETTVAEYAERMSEGERFPPVQLFADGDRYFIGDGWHRLGAAKKLRYATFPAVINPGGRTAALKFALSANASHGLQRTNEDKLRALAIAATEFPDVSNREMARICAVSEAFVRAQRPRCARNAPEGRVVGGDGKTYAASKPKGKPVDKADIDSVLDGKVKRACTIIGKLTAPCLALVRAKVEERWKALNPSPTAPPGPALSA